MPEADRPEQENEDTYGLERSPDLLYPFYLDVDMSMAFAAVLTGGVALEEEQVDRSSDTSRAVKNLRGNLRVWRAGGFEAGRESTEASDIASESRLIRRHTDASIFIDLYDELQRTGRLRQEPPFEELAVGDFVALNMGPAVAPLRRVVEQVVRLLDLMAPILGIESDSPGAVETRGPRSSKRQPSSHAQRHANQPKSEAVRNHELLTGLFRALSEDLEQSGMIDIVVAREDSPNVVLTLDKRFVSAPTLELLHTSRFTVVGKVSEIWRTDSDFVNLYRRSVLSLVPALAQATAWGLFGLLGAVGGGIDVQEMQRAANEAIGIQTPKNDEAPSAPSHTGQPGADQPADQEGTAEAAESAEQAPGVMMSAEAVAALVPGISGPAFQVQPLAICS